MDFSKIQIIGLCIITTILTDKFLIDHPSPPSVITPANTPTPTIPIPTPSVSAVNSQNEIILRELLNLRKDMTASLNELKKQPPGNDSPAPTLNASLIGGMVKISSSQYPRLDVFEKPKSSTKIIGSLIYDTIYFYRQKTDGWYQLDLDGGQTGWVQSQFLKEFP
jgi:hypothetical protein